MKITKEEVLSYTLTRTNRNFEYDERPSKINTFFKTWNWISGFCTEHRALTALLLLSTLITLFPRSKPID